MLKVSIASISGRSWGCWWDGALRGRWRGVGKLYFPEEPFHSPHLRWSSQWPRPRKRKIW